MPNFYVPMVQQGQQGQRPGGRRGAGPVQQNQPPVPLMQQQVGLIEIFSMFLSFCFWTTFFTSFYALPLGWEDNWYLLMFQMLPRGGRVYRYPPGRNMPDVPMPGVAGGMLPIPYDMSSMPLRDGAVGQAMPISALASALANAPPDQQRTVCPSLHFFIFYLISKQEIYKREAPKKHPKRSCSTHS